MNTGQPVNIVRAEGHRDYVFERNAFFEILDKCDDCPIAIYSMNGQRRRGKSLTINYMKLYLEKYRISNWYETNGIKKYNFMNNCDDIDVGDSDTTQGISVWSEPFKVRTSDGREVAVLLMDCQGSASDASDNVDNAIIFSMSLLLSSVFIHNTIGDLNDILLQQFHQYADYAYQILENNYPKENSLPALNDGNIDIDRAKYARSFQNLVVWIRDWQGNNDYPFGFYSDREKPLKAKKNFKTDKMAPNPDPKVQSDEVRTARAAIDSMFENVFCFLSPFPGRYATETTFDGKMDFKTVYGQCLKNFIERIFKDFYVKPKSFRDKTFSRIELRQLFDYIRDDYTKDDKLPKFKTETEASHELKCREGVKTYLDFYVEKMNTIANLPIPAEPDVFKEAHSGFMEMSVTKFKNATVAASEIGIRFTDELLIQINKSYETLSHCNLEKWQTIHNDLLRIAGIITPFVSGFVFFRDCVPIFNEPNCKNPTMNMLTSTAMLTLDACTLGTGSIVGKTVFYGRKNGFRAGMTYANGTENASDMTNFTNKKNAVKGMIESLIKQISNNANVVKEYDSIRLRRMITASALEDLGITDTDRQELLLNVLEKKFLEIGGNIEGKLYSKDLLQSLKTILKVVEHTEIDDEFPDLTIIT